MSDLTVSQPVDLDAVVEARNPFNKPAPKPGDKAFTRIGVPVEPDKPNWSDSDKASSLVKRVDDLNKRHTLPVDDSAVPAVNSSTAWHLRKAMSAETLAAVEQLSIMAHAMLSDSDDRRNFEAIEVTLTAFAKASRVYKKALGL